MNGRQAASGPLLEAAQELFARNGYDGTSVRQITRAADVNLGAVTYHFGSKRELYEAVLERSARPLVRVVEDAAREAGRERGASARDGIASVLHTVLEHVRARPDVPALLLQEVAVGREAPEPVARALRQCAQVLAELIRRGKSEGSVDAGDPGLTASSLLSEALASSLVRRAMVGGDGTGVGARRWGSAGVESHVLGFVGKALTPDGRSG